MVGSGANVRWLVLSLDVSLTLSSLYMTVDRVLQQSQCMSTRVGAGSYQGSLAPTISSPARKVPTVLLTILEGIIEWIVYI